MAKTSVPDFEAGTYNPYVVHPGEITDGDRFGYKVICVVRKNAWAAYRGPTLWSDGKVASAGDLVLEEVASLLFPSVATLGLIYDI